MYSLETYVHKGKNQ
uniref:Uncharacterized protein n=1 Tax=Anguilla anguilla TaxID=7936 RepID=A0A0E9TIL8_ANGAN